METALIVLSTIVGLTFAMMIAAFMVTIVCLTKNRNIFGIDKKQVMDIYDELIDHAIDSMPKIMKKSMEVTTKLFEEDDL